MTSPLTPEEVAATRLEQAKRDAEIVAEVIRRSKARVDPIFATARRAHLQETKP